jgi:hypothetical protein
MLKCVFKLGVGVSFTVTVDEHLRRELFTCLGSVSSMPVYVIGHVSWQLDFAGSLTFLDRVREDATLQAAIVEGMQYMCQLFNTTEPLTFDWLLANVSCCTVDVITPGERGYTAVNPPQHSMLISKGMSPYRSE